MVELIQKMAKFWVLPEVQNPSDLVRRRFGNGSETVRKRFGNGSEMVASGKAFWTPEIWALGCVQGENSGAKSEPFPNHFQTVSEPFPNRFQTISGDRGGRQFRTSGRPLPKPKIWLFFEFILPPGMQEDTEY